MGKRWNRYRKRGEKGGTEKVNENRGKWKEMKEKAEWEKRWNK